MDISTQTFRESYTDYYNQKILANENADENDWRSMSDKQWDKMLDGIDDYVDDFKENLKRLKEMQDKAEDIADNAFEGCDKLTIYGIKGSYAEQYANKHDIPFEELNNIVD